MLDKYFEPPETEAVLFDFDQGRRLLGESRVGQSVNRREAVELYQDSGVAEWVGIREGKFTEQIQPELMYVTTDNETHAVAWIRHSGVHSDKDGEPVHYSTHHVVCDCAADELDQVLRPGQLPESPLNCDVVKKVLFQRAVELSAQHRVPDTLSPYVSVDEKTGSIGLSPVGRDVAKVSIASFMERDKLHPEAWAANKISGLHEVELLATYLGYSTAEVMLVLDTMEEQGLATIRGDEVQLIYYPTAPGVEGCSEQDIRDALQKVNQFKDNIDPAEALSMLQKLMGARVTQETPSLIAEIQDSISQVLSD